VPDSGRSAVVGIHTVQETVTSSNTNTFDDDIARGVLRGPDLGNNQQASTEEVAIVPGDSEQINGIPLEYQFLMLDFPVVWNVELYIPTSSVPNVIPSTTWVEQVLEGLEARSGVASNDGQQRIPAVSIWSRRLHSRYRHS
jgi:hypothetical protein